MISGTVALALYMVVQLLIAVIRVNRVPALTAFFLASLVVLAFAVGLIFKDRAFCRGFCPVGQLLATYGRGGILVVRQGCAQICRACSDRKCTEAAARQKVDGRSCPSLLNPSRLDNSTDCLLCAQCIKACQPDNNMRLLLRLPFHASDARQTIAAWPVTLFVMMESGFVISEVCEQWPKAKHLFGAAPHWVRLHAGLIAYAGYVNWLWTMVVFPLTVWTLMGVALRLFGFGPGLGGVWRRMALPMAVVISVGHMVNALAEMDLCAGFLPHALRDPVGRSTLRALAEQAIIPPAPLLPLAMIAHFGMFLLIAGLWYAIREARLAHPDIHSRHLLPEFGLASVLILLVFGWTLGAA